MQHDYEIEKRAGHDTLTAVARSVFEDMSQKMDDDLCNAIAGMGYTERKEFVNWVVARAPEPMVSPKALTKIQAWWLKKLKTGVMLDARPDEGWVHMPTISELVDDYIKATHFVGVSRRGNETTMGRFLKNVMQTLRKVQIRQPAPTNRIGRATTTRHYDMPKLSVARAFWDEKHGAHVWTQKFYRAIDA